MKSVSDHNLIKELLCPPHLLPWAFTSSFSAPLVWKIPREKILLDPNIQSNFLFAKLQISTFGEKSYAGICFRTLWIILATLKCHRLGCSLLVISLAASETRTVGKYMKHRQAQGRLFRTNRGAEDFNLNPLFHTSVFLWKSGYLPPIPISCIFCSPSPNTRPKQLTSSCRLQGRVPGKLYWSIFWAGISPQPTWTVYFQIQGKFPLCPRS